MPNVYYVHNVLSVCTTVSCAHCNLQGGVAGGGVASVGGGEGGASLTSLSSLLFNYLLITN